MDRPLFRAFSQMPFAGHHCPIPSRAQQLGHGGTIGAEMILIGGTVRGGARPGGIAVNHHANAHLVRIPSGHQRRARGATPRLIVELSQRHAALGQAVYVGRGDFRTEAANVRIPEVIGQD